MFIAHRRMRIFWTLILHKFTLSGTRPRWSSASAPGAHPLFEIVKWFVFEKFDSLTRINFIVISMHMYFILYSRYKSIGYVWRGIKTISRPWKNYTAAGLRPRLMNSWIRHCYTCLSIRNNNKHTSNSLLLHVATVGLKNFPDRI